MKLLRTLIIFDQGGLQQSTGWIEIHDSYERSINSIDFPLGSGSLTLRRKTRKPNSQQWNRNGVSYLKTRFLRHLVDVEKWSPEGTVDIKQLHSAPVIKLHPSGQAYQEPVTSKFGGFDFVSETKSGDRVGIEWETGNISSSHRSLNKLVIALESGFLDLAVLVVPSRLLYEHLTDRIGNINELSAYLSFWEKQKQLVKRGLLAISVVEHDKLTDNSAFPYLKVGMDGRARKPHI